MRIRSQFPAKIAFATKKVFSAAANDAEMGFDFQQAALDAIEAGDASFEYDGATYELTTTEEETSTEVVKNGEVLCHCFPIFWYLLRQRVCSFLFPLKKQ